MDDRRRALYTLTPRPVVVVLQELAELGTRERKGEPTRLPMVTLHLKSGRDLRGFLLGISEYGAGAHEVLMHAPGGDPRNPDFDAVHVSSSAIEALTLHDVPSQTRAPESARAVPTKLELKRAVLALENELTRVAKSPMTVGLELKGDESSDALRALADLRDQVEWVMLGIANEQLGRDALVTKVKRIELRLTASPAVSLEKDQTLVLTTTSTWASRMTRDALKGAVEALL